MIDRNKLEGTVNFVGDTAREFHRGRFATICVPIRIFPRIRAYGQRYNKRAAVFGVAAFMMPMRLSRNWRVLEARFRVSIYPKTRLTARSDPNNGSGM